VGFVRVRVPHASLGVGWLSSDVVVWDGVSYFLYCLIGSVTDGRVWISPFKKNHEWAHPTLLSILISKRFSDI
jgi:hypothetical protein